jgi:peptidase M48-like protein/PDZ domain-containing protein
MRFPRPILPLLSSLGLVAAASIGSPASAEGMSIRTLAGQQLRVETIGYRLAIANARFCAQPEMMSGLLLHDLSQYPSRDRAAISGAFSLHGGFGVLGVVKNGAGEKAGLQVDDEIVAVNGRSVEDFNRAYYQRQTFDRMAGFQRQLEQSLRRGPAELWVRRKGQLLRVALTGEQGCGGDAVLQQSGGINAWSDGRYVVVTTGLASFAASDDEISFVMAHEMAHNMLGHNRGHAPSALMEIFGIGSARERREESNADAMAVTLMKDGGYEPQSAVRFLEHCRRKLWWADLSISHPTFSSRIQTVASAISALQPTFAAPVQLASRMPSPAVRRATAIARAYSISGSALGAER